MRGGAAGGVHTGRSPSPELSLKGEGHAFEAGDAKVELRATSTSASQVATLRPERLVFEAAFAQAALVRCATR
jgi:hypothetical protein